MHSCVFREISFHLSLLTDENNNVARKSRAHRIICHRAILRIARQALYAWLPTNFKQGLHGFFKRTTVRHIPITSCVSAVYAMRFIVVAYITTSIIYFDFSVRRASQNVSRPIRLAYISVWSFLMFIAHIRGRICRYMQEQTQY